MQLLSLITFASIAGLATFWIARVGCPRRRGASIIALGIAGTQLLQMGHAPWLVAATALGGLAALVERRVRPDRVAACAVPGLRHAEPHAELHPTPTLSSHQLAPRSP